MEQLPGNSNKAKQEKAKSRVEAPVVQTEIKVGKPSLGRRFKSTFVQGDASTVWGYVVWDVLMPAAKDMVADAVTQGVEKMIFGEARSVSRRGYRGTSSTTGTTTVNYGAYSSSSRPGTPPPATTARVRTGVELAEIIISTRPEAEIVLEQMDLLIEKYKACTVADYYDLVGYTGNFTDDKWGWTNLAQANIARVHQGYILELPRLEQIAS